MPVVLMFQVRVVVVFATRFPAPIATWPIFTPVAAAGVMNAGTPAPPLVTLFNAPPAAPEPAAAAVTALAGMTSPAAPSFRAAAPLGTHAHTETAVRPDDKIQAVWMVLVVLPALAAVLGVSAKFTVFPAVTLTVSDSVRVAFRTTVPTFELS